MLRTKKCHQIRQFHFTEWHENGEMDNREALIHFVREVQEYKKENSSNCPTLVHCRTGTVRSGIFIALYCIINQQECGNKVDVYGTVQKMHLHRPLMVETEDQYIFLHHCALDVVKGKKNVNAEEKRQENTEERVYEQIPNTFSKVQTRQSEELYERTLQI
ncbi:unnamed protein product [Ranitomeya imitator]|uniref:Uncharacterized protein n=1 Tax=Ranitomeya imitator TaxID=111125 RepID=A0ABN9ML73_9NEOB|nr:unnamed protein product [Ranitomeya imitator]